MLLLVLLVLSVLLPSFVAWTHFLLLRHLPHRLGIGNGALAVCVEGAVAIGTSVMAGCCALCVDGCAVVVGGASSCCEVVCVSVVVCGLAIIFAVGSMMKLDAVELSSMCC